MYTFDALNRLQTYSNDTDTVSYKYYADGLRASKDEDGQKTNYVYLNGKVIEEVGASGNVLAQTIWGNTPLFRKDFTTNKTGYYLYNSHGDVTEITDTSGNTLNSYEYDSWGNILSQTQEMSNPFTYTGEMYDKETGNYYLRARYYDPTVGRFISEDTYKGQVDNPLSLNRYTYTNNNPIRFVDPTGNRPTVSSDRKEERIQTWVNIVEQRVNSGMTHSDALAQVPNDIERDVEFRVIMNDEDLVMAGLGGRGGGGFNGVAKQATGQVTKSSFSLTNKQVTKFVPNPTTNKNLANSIANKYGGILTNAKGDGYTVTIPNVKIGDKTGEIVLRIMNTSKQNDNYWRLSIGGKGAVDSKGNFSSKPGLTHISITENSYENITQILNKYIP